jgi:hypothetical protein
MCPKSPAAPAPGPSWPSPTTDINGQTVVVDGGQLAA